MLHLSSLIAISSWQTPQAETLATAVATPTLTQNVPGLPDFLANRQPIASAGVEISGGSNIADLEGSLGHEDLMEAKARALNAKNGMN